MNSCSTLPAPALETVHQSVDSGKLRRKGFFDTPGPSVAVSNLAYMLATQAELEGHSAKDSCCELFPIDRRGHILFERDISTGGAVPQVRSNYLGADISVNKKNRERIEAGVRLGIGENIRRLRKERGLTQVELAELIGVRQSSIARWEAETDRPLAAMLVRISELVSAEERQWWRDQAAEQAGIGPDDVNSSNTSPKFGLSRTIPLLKDPRKVGTLGTVQARDIEQQIILPQEWFQEGGSIQAVRIIGSTISPLLEGPYIAIVDISRRDPDRLVGCTVAIQTASGLEVRMLRKDESTYLLVPLREGVDQPIRVLRMRGENSIVGQVLKWLGDAPSPSTQKS